MAQRSFSETLKKLGFILADKAGIFITRSKGNMGQFYSCKFADRLKTIAVDEEGNNWVKSGRINLSSRGFQPYEPCGDFCWPS